MYKNNFWSIQNRSFQRYHTHLRGISTFSVKNYEALILERTLLDKAHSGHPCTAIDQRWQRGIVNGDEHIEK